MSTLFGKFHSITSWKIALTVFSQSKWLDKWAMGLSLFWPIYSKSLWLVSYKSSQTDPQELSQTDPEISSQID